MEVYYEGSNDFQIKQKSRKGHVWTDIIVLIYRSVNVYQLVAPLTISGLDQDFASEDESRQVHVAMHSRGNHSNVTV